MQTIVFKCTYLVDSAEDCYRESVCHFILSIVFEALLIGASLSEPHIYVKYGGGRGCLFIYKYMCVCVCVCVSRTGKRVNLGHLTHFEFMMLMHC